MLIVFTILLTRREDEDVVGFNWSGVLVAIVVFAGLLWTILNTASLSVAAPAIEALTVKRIGEVLMTNYVWPLQCVGLLLTAALIGALVLVMEEKPMTPTLQLCLIVSAALFSIGLLAALSRRHAIFILIGIEMMLAAANLNFIAFLAFRPRSAESHRRHGRHLFHRHRRRGSRRRPRARHRRLPPLSNDQRPAARSAQRMNPWIVEHLWLFPLCRWRLRF